jgi:hypothetical protein
MFRNLVTGVVLTAIFSLTLGNTDAEARHCGRYRRCSNWNQGNHYGCNNGNGHRGYGYGNNNYGYGRSGYSNVGVGYGHRGYGYGQGGSVGFYSSY